MNKRKWNEDWKAILACPAALGDFTWTGYDYMGETGPREAFPRLFSEVGDISAVGYRRPMSYYREIVFGLRTAPYICVRPPECFGKSREFGPWKFTDGVRSWNFAGQEGADVTVEVFSAGDTVELFLNDKSLGKKENGTEIGCYVSFDLKYEPGQLRAVSWRGEEKLGENTLATNTAAASVHVEKEDYRGKKDSTGLIFLNIVILDQEGKWIHSAENELSLELKAGGELLAFGSMGTPHHKGFRETAIKAESGAALAILKAKEGERVSVVLHSPGLPDAVVELE